MSIYDEGKKRLACLLKWKETEAYKEICISRKNESERLICIGESGLENIQDLDWKTKNSTKRIEYATGGDIHRGVYCPSPVLDIVIGNAHRGRILKRVISSSKVSHRFCFDSENRLLCCETLSEGEVVSAEYIIEQGDFRYGITVNANYELGAISEEQFSDQKIIRYSYLEVYPDRDGYFCANLHIEKYIYDELGLKICEEEDFEPYVNNLKKFRYDFERNNGYLSEYFAVDCLLEEAGIEISDLPKYTVRFKRKA